MERRRARVRLGPMTYGIAAYVICRKSDAEVKKEIDRICEVKDTAGYFRIQRLHHAEQARARVIAEGLQRLDRGLTVGSDRNG